MKIRLIGDFAGQRAKVEFTATTLYFQTFKYSHIHVFTQTVNILYDSWLVSL